MSDKHTPGPWLAIDTRDNDIDGWQGAFGVLAEKQPIGAMYNDICTVWTRAGKERTNANAALIAAAPTMLTALESIEKWIAGDWHLVECYENHLLTIRAAISKAKGTP